MIHENHLAVVQKDNLGLENRDGESADRQKDEAVSENFKAEIDTRSNCSNNDKGLQHRSNMGNSIKAFLNDGGRYSSMIYDNFDRKYILYIDRGGQASIYKHDRQKSFSIRLIGTARQFYFESPMYKIFNLLSSSNAVEEQF